MSQKNLSHLKVIPANIRRVWRYRDHKFLQGVGNIWQEGRGYIYTYLYRYCQISVSLYSCPCTPVSYPRLYPSATGKGSGQSEVGADRLAPYGVLLWRKSGYAVRLIRDHRFGGAQGALLSSGCWGYQHLKLVAEHWRVKQGQPMEGTSSGTESAPVPTQLAILVPTFDPAVDNVEIWASKVELLAATWPATKLTELSTRLILGCKGTAYQKLQLHQKELLVNDPKSIQKLVELVGGTWGQIPLEKKFELVERAIFRGQQKNDETADSFVSRNDVVWTELLAKNIKMEEIRAYVLLRGSKLANEDKKRVIVESGAESGGALDVKRVTAAIRMLGSGFFQELTGNRRDRTLKTYDHQAFNMEEEIESVDGEHSFWTTADDFLDDNMLETLAAEDDEDALMVLQFEDSIAETVQSDNELSAFFSVYQDARKRLSEKTRFRGFWGVSRKGSDAKGFGKKGKSSKGKGKGGLERRIANSYCRICWKKGHWKNECPMKPGSSSGSSTSSTMPSSIPTSYVTTEEIPPELSQLEAIEATSSLLQQEVWCLTVHDNIGDRRYKMGPIDRKIGDLKKVVGARNKLISRFGHLVESFGKFRKRPLSDRSDRHIPIVSKEQIGEAEGHKIETLRSHIHHSHANDHIQECHFASSGTVGVVDLGASQTVIGSQQVGELLNQLPWQVKQKVKRTSCHLVFRFGNHQTLVSRHALVLPLGTESFRIAVVDGKTPFLLSNTFLKGIQAVIDTHEGTLWSKKLGRYLNIEPSNKNLFLMDINQLWNTTEDNSIIPETVGSDITDPVDCHIMEEKTKANEETEKGSSSVEDREQKHENFHASDVSQVVRPDESHSLTDGNHVGQEGPSISCVSTSEKLVSPSSHVQGKGISEAHAVPPRDVGGRECGTSSTDSGNVARGAIGDDHSLWEGKTGDEIPRSVQRPSLDRLVCGTIRGQSEGRASEVCGLRREATRCGSPGRQGPFQGQIKDEDGSQSESQECTQVHGLRELLDSSASGRDRQRGGHDRASSGLIEPAGSDREHSRTSGVCIDGESQPGQPLDTSRDGDERDAYSLEAAERQARALMSDLVMESPKDRSETKTQWSPDNDFVFHVPCGGHQQTYHRVIQRKVQQFQKELRECVDLVKHRKSLGPRCDLIEVMCSENSELTIQVQQAGGRAVRFGLSQGDLQQKESRHKLFMLIAIHRPRNVWISPECRPWCLWSGYNMSKSEDLMEKILLDRLQSLWQISLGIVLLQHQVQNGCHFHMEQPSGSQMWNIPGSQCIVQNTFRCCFDLCKVGQLKDPKSQMPIRKRLVVQSTSEVLYRELHGKYCDKQHEHKTIEGNTTWQGRSVSLSKYTENYPSKFAKQIVRLIMKEKVRIGIPTCVGESEETHPTKRRRLLNKLSPAAIEENFPDVNWQTVMENVNKETPRVGTKVITHGNTIDMIQKTLSKPRHSTYCSMPGNG